MKIYFVSMNFCFNLIVFRTISCKSFINLSETKFSISNAGSLSFIIDNSMTSLSLITRGYHISDFWRHLIVLLISYAAMEVCRIVLHTICSLITAILYRIEGYFVNHEENPWGKWKFDFLKKTFKVSSFFETGPRLLQVMAASKAKETWLKIFPSSK